MTMNTDEWADWIARTIKILKAIEFNYDHPSPMRKVIGGLEIDTIRQLIKETED